MFLASAASGYVTGIELFADGGMAQDQATVGNDTVRKHLPCPPFTWISATSSLASSEMRVSLWEQSEETMTINLPDELERFIRAEVRSGHFSSEEAALAEAVRLLQHKLGQNRPQAGEEIVSANTPDPILGVMRDAADEMDAVVVDAMKKREQQAWRLPPSE
jgi:Arc/MetJ-type ribon-helix-helix transcriptional regulator